MDMDYSPQLAALRMAMEGGVRRYDEGGSVMGAQPVFVPGLGMIDPATGAPLPSYMGQASAPQAVAAGQPQGMPQQVQGPAPQPQQAPVQAQGAPSGGGGGSTLASLLSNPLIGALLGGGLGALGGGGKGALIGALGGPLLGSNMAGQLNAAQTQDPNTSLAALSARYLPLLAASYAGSFYKNPTAPQYGGRPASQSASLPTATPTGAPKPKVGSWYTYGQVPDFTLDQKARGGMEMRGGGSSLTSGSNRFVPGSDSGVSDRVAASLSSGEYVVPAHVVAALGDGNSTAGAKALDRLQDNVRVSTGKQMAKGKHPKRAAKPEKYMDEDSDS